MKLDGKAFITDKNAPDLVAMLRKLAADIHAGVQPRGVIWRANSWFGALPSPGVSERVSGGGTSNPTSSAATGVADWTTTVAADIARQAQAVERAVAALATTLRRCEPVHETTRAADDLADENIGAGICQLCGRTCSGQRDDRLSTLTVPETYTHLGVSEERRYQRRSCQPCRDAWRRAKDRGEQFADWERHRQAGQEREAG